MVSGRRNEDPEKVVCFFRITEASAKYDSPNSTELISINIVAYIISFIKITFTTFFHFCNEIIGATPDEIRSYTKIYNIDVNYYCIIVLA